MRRGKTFLVLTCLACVGALMSASIASAAFRSEITEATANLANRQLKVKGFVECFKTPGEIVPGTGIPYLDGCGPEEEEGWPRIAIKIHDGATGGSCRPGNIDYKPFEFGRTQMLRSFLPSATTTVVPFSFTRPISILGAKWVCVENKELTEIPINRLGCDSGEPCFYWEVITASRIKWVGQPPKK